MVAEARGTRKGREIEGPRMADSGCTAAGDRLSCAKQPARDMGTAARVRSIVSLCGAACLTVLCVGCAIHHFDQKTGTEHIWGFGHMKMKVAQPREEARAVVGQTETVGLAVGSIQESGFAVIGWQRLTRLMAIDANAAVRLEWPNSDLFNVRVGTQPPWAVTNQPAATDTNKE